MELNKIYQGEAKQVLQDFPDQSINTCVTSPPYWGLRDYGVEGQLGLEDTPEEYVERLTEIFHEVKRVLKDDGTLWLNLGDSYYNHRPGGTSQTQQSVASNEGAVVDSSPKRENKIDGLKEKDLVGIPWRVAFALQDDGWYLRNDIIWHKPNPMPESVTDRCTTSHEHIFLMSKSKDYYYDQNAIKERANYAGENRGKSRNISPDGKTEMDNKVYDTRNKRDVWEINTKPFPEAHFAVYPPDLIRPCIKAGCPEDGIVLDPFIGAGTTAYVAKEQDCNYVGIELNEEYIEIAEDRISEVQKALI